MRAAGKTVVVTGGGRGIGRALCERFAAEGAAGVVVADRDPAPAREVADRIGGLAVCCDVADPDALVGLVAQARAHLGRIDLFCSNAGILGGKGLDNTTDEQWQRTWDVNVMAHIRAARLVVPYMLEAGGGYLLQIVSAAGLITSGSPAPYSVTKHAAIGFAEWMAVRYGDRGIGISCVCPTAVDTDMLRQGTRDPELAPSAARVGQIVRPEAIADAVMVGLADETFLILPETRVGDSFRRKATDYDQWLAGTRRRLQKSGG